MYNKFEKGGGHYEQKQIERYRWTENQAAVF